jgi:lincosamide nucleotidyltransferase A/C/D/E
MRNPGRGAALGRSLGRSLRRGVVRVARATYVGIERSPLAPVLRIPPVQRFKSQITYTPASRVLALLDLLEVAGVTAWVAGGWGVDALAGRQTRRHYDLDLLISNDPGDYRKVSDVLTAAGFRLTESEHNPDLPMPWRHFWQHDDGCSVEVLPVTLQDPPFCSQAFAYGIIDGQRVPCLSAALQVTLHSGYSLRDVDAADTALLRAYLPPALPLPPK